MATCEEFLDDLRDRLDDDGDTRIPEATKIRFLNRGQAAMFPKIYRIERDSTLAIVADQWEYDIPAAVGNNGKIIQVDIEDADGRLFPVVNYRLIDGLDDPILQLTGASLPTAGVNIRITAAMPLTAFASSASTYTGPPYSEELPVLYALSQIMAREVERRFNNRRMPTVEGLNGSTAEDMMTASQFFMQQFQTLLEQIQMPIPAGF